MNTVLGQLRSIGVKPNIFTRGEIKELPNILMPEEEIFHAVGGWYDDGVALLCATNHRVLLIDKKPFFLTVEDLRYDMIVEVKYQYRLLDSTIQLTYARKSLDFKSWHQKQLRELVTFVQQTTMEIKRRAESQQEHTPQVPEMVHEHVDNSGHVEQEDTKRFADMPQPSQYAYPKPPAAWKNPYQTGRQLIQRSKMSRFVTQSQLRQ